jgi:hypothetical protein
MVIKFLVAAVFVLIGSAAVMSATVGPALVGFDGYDHSSERTADASGTVDAGY